MLCMYGYYYVYINFITIVQKMIKTVLQEKIYNYNLKRIEK